MGMYRKEWDCCNSVTETDAWEPETCPFCNPVVAVKSSKDITDIGVESMKAEIEYLTDTVHKLKADQKWWRDANREGGWIEDLRLRAINAEYLLKKLKEQTNKGEGK